MSLFSLEWWQIALLFLPALLNLWGIWHAFNHTFETPLERVLWMVACVFVPVLGGVAYVLDEESTLYRNLNKAMVSMEKVESKFDREELYRLIDAHVQHTGSPKGRRILAAFGEYLPRFKKIIPNDYKRLVQLASQFEEQGVTPEQAQIEAFYASLAKK